ncbi:SGNH/GDSL hydrolase family protein [Mesorhizobium sp. YC-39]|uniref:SGNH/GDSL hydrolase family protein n=1 Tax=unclassified Mesorhizobium TaxID=325217 RepID=UPI0021E87EAD|nr:MULTISPECIES: SGNH/GDSL hydrolase family protein [unclassified Mesorhizobium]MCV3209595.1 SGNH/GDSL hydrolase family protein [Mesorhizobium sp. YC-2]MCV3230125.1 SGNH/GDSL hydrolase family protein [Mesorhizobium sp. YC-39]
MRVVLGRSREDREADLIAQLSRSRASSIVLLGDSLVATSQANRGSSDVVMAAVGRSRISDILAIVGRIKSNGLWDRVGGFVVSVGINDAEWREGDDLQSRTIYFRSMLDALIRACLDRPVAILTITEPDKTGTQVDRFSRDLIERQNAEIRAVGQRAIVFDMDAKFRASMAEAGLPVSAGFSDGVHISDSGYRCWRPLLVECIHAVRAKSRQTADA